jgi:GR25 family glycosyltransferase involved in LPS biosynthesis
MKAYAIVLENNDISTTAYKRLITTTKRKIMPFKAVTGDHDEVNFVMDMFDIEWKYPWDSPMLDIKSGLMLNPYPTKNKMARIGCALSHYVLWRTCLVHGEPIMILEHDAIFTDEIDFDISNTRFDILGLNHPAGATRRARQYFDAVQSNTSPYQRPPVIDADNVPQGLAGNSAYIITPNGATTMLDLVDTHGLWPNDALMCRQLVPKLGITRRFYTKVQGTESTTSR